MTPESIFTCCSNPPIFLIKYDVAGKNKIYRVCNICVNLECFQKHIIEKLEL